jgi:hypothetical protein
MEEIDSLKPVTASRRFDEFHLLAKLMLEILFSGECVGDGESNGLTANCPAKGTAFNVSRPPCHDIGTFNF